MPHQPSQWICAGRFPPPYDGQSLLTQELLELLSPEFSFIRADATARPPEGRIYAPGRLRLRRIPEMFRYIHHLRWLTTRYPLPILYAIFSGNPLGHIRDCVTFAWAIPRRRPVVVWTHNALLSLHASPLWHRTLHWLTRRATLFVFAGRSLYEPLRDILPEEQIAIIPNLVRRALLCSQTEVERKLAHADVSSRLRLLFVGHMLPEKGGWQLLEAAFLLRRHGVPFQLTYVGGWVTSHDASAFTRRIAELGLSRQIVHHGSIRDPETLRQLYLSHHLFLLPTKHPTEAQPTSILEALNAGCAVIGTPHATLPEIIQPGVNGFLVLQHPREIAEAIAHYWHNPNLWYSHARAARQLFVERFHPDRIRQQWIELLRRVQQSIPELAQVTT